MTSVEIDRDAARDAAQAELSKPIYPKRELMDRFSEWLDELIYRIMLKGSEIPGGWFTLALLLTLVIVAIIVAVRIARNAIRTGARGEYPIFDANELSAAEHRAIAERCAQQGDWPAAIRHRLRALARQLEEDGVFNPMPGRTANELAREASRTMTELSDEFSEAAVTFNDVTYGERPGSGTAYRRVADLDDRLRSGQTGAGAATAASGSPDRWADLP